MKIILLITTISIHFKYSTIKYTPVLQIIKAQKKPRVFAAFL